MRRKRGRKIGRLIPELPFLFVGRRRRRSLPKEEPHTAPGEKGSLQMLIKTFVLEEEEEAVL